MDTTFDVSDNIQHFTMAAKQRFESFKMGGTPPPNTLGLANYIPKHSHGRSRSRNNSISSLSTLSISASAPSIPLPFDFSLNTSTNLPSNGPPSKRPNSHHSRRSSVSTRRESAELMGLSIPDLPPAHSEDNMNLGDRDSIRRRALWALEGKPDLAFSKVEIPDITSPHLAKSFEFPTKPSFPPGIGTSGHGISSLMSKRDSFGKMFGSTSTSKDQLQTLIEEEEEEEEEEVSPQEGPAHVADVAHQGNEALVIELATPAFKETMKSISRPRPASLNLKPLSLVSGIVSSFSLPTPTSPRSIDKRSLALTHSPDHFLPTNANTTNTSTRSMKRHSITPSSTGSFSLSRCSSSSLSSENSLPCDRGRKRSSISYKRSVGSIPRDMGSFPSPNSTPTDRRFSESNDFGCVPEQSITAAEQHFLFKSHNVLLSRIIDLERTLRSRSMSRSRPLSMASDISATSFSEPSDEILQLISDLKAERDDLKRDVDGWRNRVADADKQTSVLARRVETERREAFVARSRLGLLEIENSSLEKTLTSMHAELEASITEQEQMKKDRGTMTEELNRLRARLRDADNAVSERIRLRAALEKERTKCVELEKLLDNAGLPNTPTIPHFVDRQGSVTSNAFGIRPRGLAFRSMDSDSSSTDVESVDYSFTKAEFTLDAVTEEDEDTCDFSDEEDELVGYEDVEDSELSFHSPGGSSIGSGDELDIGPVSVLNETTTRLNTLSKSTASHSPRASLSMTWTFPRGQSRKPALKSDDDDEIDRFFGCLDDVDNSPPLCFEMDKAIFTSTFGCANDDDELPPFVFPSDVGTVVSELPTSRSLEVVLEEDEDDEADEEEDGEPLGEEVDGGVRFTFNPPPTACVRPPPAICVIPPTESESALPHALERKAVHVHEPYKDEEGDCIPAFKYPQQSSVQELITPPSSSPPTSKSSSRASSGTSNSPSSIPRATSMRSFVSTTPATPPSGRLPALTSYSTPPSRRGGTTPSLIPQPISASPSKTSTFTKYRAPVLRTKVTNVNDTTRRCYSTTEKVKDGRPDPSDTCGCPDRETPSSSLLSLMSSPLAARFSFQTLSKLIPLTWTPGAAAVVSHTTPSTSSSFHDGTAEAASLFTVACPGVRRSTERRFVSRDEQLEKLRNRLSNDYNGVGRCLAVNACSACEDADIFL